MSMEKFLWLGGFLLFSNVDRTADNSLLDVTDKPVSISETREKKRSSHVSLATTVIPTENKEYPYIKSDYSDTIIQNRKSTNNYPPVSTKKVVQSGQNVPKVLSYRPIYREPKKMLAFTAKACRQIISPVQGNKSDVPLKICHARKFNQSYLRQRSLAE